jgi:hypothetical protein
MKHRPRLFIGIERCRKMKILDGCKAISFSSKTVKLQTKKKAVVRVLKKKFARSHNLIKTRNLVKIWKAKMKVQRRNNPN